MEIDVKDGFFHCSTCKMENYHKDCSMTMTKQEKESQDIKKA